MTGPLRDDDDSPRELAGRLRESADCLEGVVSQITDEAPADMLRSGTSLRGQLDWIEAVIADLREVAAIVAAGPGTGPDGAR